MELGIWIKWLAKAVLLPPTGPLLIAVVGLLIARRRRRAGYAVVWSGVLGLLLLSTSVVSGLLVQTLHVPPPFAPAAADGAGAIVILGAGVRRHAPEYGGDTLGALTLERVRYGARIARSTGLPVLVSGGAPQGGTSEASMMARALREEFGVTARWQENRSRNTHENAVFSAAMLRGEGIGTVVLVTHGFDAWRGSAEFQRAGIEVIPAPTNLPADNGVAPADFLPSMSALLTSYYALYEILAGVNRRFFDVFGEAAAARR